MTPEALKIREYIVNSAISEHTKNEILPLLGVIDTPGVKERIFKILEIEGKAADLEEKFLNLDIDNPQGNVQQPAPMQPMVAPAPVVPVPPMPMNTPVPVAPVPPMPMSAPAPVVPVPPIPMNTPVPQPMVPDTTVPVTSQIPYDDQAIKQLEDQLKQLQQK